MNDQETIFIIVAVIIALVILKYVWKFLLGLGIIGVIILTVITLLCNSGQIDCPFNFPTSNLPAQVSRTPNEDAAIEAVRRFVSGSQYRAQGERTRPVMMNCQSHHWRDRKRECERYGGRYIAIPAGRRTESRPCNEIVSPHGWGAQRMGGGRWRVFNGGRAWEARHVSGGRANMSIRNEVIHVQVGGSQFAFVVHSRQSSC